MESITLYDQFNFSAFMRRRGVMSLIGAVVSVGIALLQLFLL